MLDRTENEEKSERPDLELQEDGPTSVSSVSTEAFRRSSKQFDTIYDLQNERRIELDRKKECLRRFICPCMLS